MIEGVGATAARFLLHARQMLPLKRLGSPDPYSSTRRNGGQGAVTEGARVEPVLRCAQRADIVDQRIVQQLFRTIVQIIVDQDVHIERAGTGFGCPIHLRIETAWISTTPAL